MFAATRQRNAQRQKAKLIAKTSMPNTGRKSSRAIKRIIAATPPRLLRGRKHGVKRTTSAAKPIAERVTLKTIIADYRKAVNMLLRESKPGKRRNIGKRLVRGSGLGREIVLPNWATITPENNFPNTALSQPKTGRKNSSTLRDSKSN